jgi:hypothetical protein
MADYRKALFSIKLEVGGLKYNLLAGDTPCDLGIETDPDELKKFDFLKDAVVKPQFKFNQNKGIYWSIFKTYSDEYVYEPTCENFKQMPDEIWNTIFKKQYWNNIGGDKIKNQGVANVLSYIALKGGSLGVVYLQNNLQKIFNSYGYTLKPKENVNIMNVNWGNLDDEYIDIINELDAKGKSPELFDKLFFGYESDIIPLDQRKENENVINSFYFLNKPYASSFKDKTLFIGGILGVIGGLVILSRLE